MADEQDQSAPGVCPGCGGCRVCGRRNGDQVVVPYPVPSPWGGGMVRTWSGLRVRFGS